MNDKVRKVFSTGPMASFQSVPKLSSYLIQVKFQPLQRKVGSSKCGKQRCEVCNNVTNTTIFSSTVTGNTFKVNRGLKCDDTYLIYLLTGKQYNKQCNGENTDQFLME